MELDVTKVEIFKDFCVKIVREPLVLTLNLKR